MNVTKRANNLLASAFTRNGIIAWSATDTCEGELKLWIELENAGLVQRQAFRSHLGHLFSYRLTDDGRKYLGDTQSPYDYPFFCKVCRNSFSSRNAAIEHHTRKHPHFGLSIYS